MADPEFDDGLALTAGSLVGEYEVGRLLGRGGFGAVYAGTHPIIGKHVAIKVLPLRYSTDREMVSRFVAEARAVNQIRHQHIIDIFSFGKLPDGRQYYVMELLEGTTLDRYLADRERLSITDTLQLLQPIALALDAAHAAGIVHRDLKPENIFIARDAQGAPFPKLLDFGIAKLLGPAFEVDHSTQSGLMMGTPYYMSPEQCRGKQVDHRTDLYALGAMTYQLLTGQVPFPGTDRMAIIFQQLNDQVRPPSMLLAELAPIDEAVLAMLAKDPEDRPDSAVEAVNAIGDLVGVPALRTIARPLAKAPPIADEPATPTRQLRARQLAVDTTAQLPRGETASLAPRVAPPTKRHTGLVAAMAVVLVTGGLTVWKVASRGAEPVPNGNAPDGSTVQGEVAIESTPADATIYLGSRSAGAFATTPWHGVLRGDQRILIEKRGYKVAETTASIEPGKPSVIAIELTVDPNAAWVDVTVNAAGALFYLDDVAQGAIARAPVSLNVETGMHQFIVRSAGYDEYRQELEVLPGQSYTVNAALHRSPASP